MANLNQEWTDVMVDLETTHTRPDHGAILQIAAVKFNLEKRTVCPDFFEACLTIPPHRHWSMDTANWWNRQKPGILKDIMSRARDWRQVTTEFAQFGYDSPGMRFWSKPVTFDYMFTAGYFADVDLINPFHYRDARDLNTFLEGIHYPNPVPNIPWDNLGDAHNALNDTLMQLKWLFAHLESVEKGKEDVCTTE